MFVEKYSVLHEWLAPKGTNKVGRWHGDRDQFLTKSLRRNKLRHSSGSFARGPEQGKAEQNNSTLLILG